MRVALLSLIKNANIWLAVMAMSTCAAIASPTSIEKTNGINNPPVWTTLPTNKTTCLGEAVTPITFTVTEEYREIGVMKAIGITDFKIRSLYLVKYLMLAVVGAAIGFLASIPFGNMLLQL